MVWNMWCGTCGDGSHLGEVAGVDLTALTDVGLETVLLVVLELGADMSANPTEKHSCS